MKASGCVEALEGEDRPCVGPHLENERVRGAQVCIAAPAGKGNGEAHSDHDGFIHPKKSQVI